MPGVIGTYLKFEEGYITKNPIFDAMLFISLGFFILCALDVGLHFYLGYINRLYSHRSIEQELQLTNQPSNNPSNDDTIELRPLPYSRPCPSPDSSPCPPPDSSPCPSLDSIPCRRNVFSDKDSEVFAAIEGFVLVSSLTYHEFYEGMTLWSSTSPERAWWIP